MTASLPSDDVAAADMVLFRTSPPTAPGPALDLLRRCAPEMLGDVTDARLYLLVDVAAEDPHQALAAALVVPGSTPERARMVALAVEPSRRRRGLATRLLSDVRRSLQAGGEILEFCTNADDALTKMLRRLGFAEDPDVVNDGYSHRSVGRPVLWRSRET
ncbi:GNAT family N-acetyltransferase [Cryptosporangium aurantiacum]|uniref:GNAT family N-acetyltransferase n=1 Tax=Cryptosporangium aurantiacum TaxID=134849 RepID=UPI0015BD902D|nr:GNAT family N-acetyltransferase [Cryptosporangium aurantiacum]